ncbi:hypothetical protein [Arenicella sp. 4NH20-0111]|uniref:hypothetical protein n=1 Tax=Arenicella sp. 4NH20-0111 TaxID=3127648 RepID=UPI0033413AE8
MKAIKLMLIGDIIDSSRKKGELVLVVSKMNRLFFFSDNKKFTLGFPFSVTESEDGLQFESKFIANVDSRLTSEVLNVLSQERLFENSCSLEFSESLVDVEDYHDQFMPFLLDLLMYEDGYLRHDKDEENCNGDIHPLFHFDFFYSSISTCKFGTDSHVQERDMIDLLKTETNCHYLGKR